jgi:hypothetical protein
MLNRQAAKDAKMVGALAVDPSQSGRSSSGSIEADHERVVAGEDQALGDPL